MNGPQQMLRTSQTLKKGGVSFLTLPFFKVWDGVRLIAAAMLLLSGCATTTHQSVTSQYAIESPIPFIETFSIDPSISAQLHKINPEYISQKDIDETLAHYPAPRIFGIGGGVYTAHILMEDLAEFLIGMGYPKQAIFHPTDGKFAMSAYLDPEKIAGECIYYYEREGVRPILIGHSLGGVQAMKTAHFLVGNFGRKPVQIFNPIRSQFEKRTYYVDPYTGDQKELAASPIIAHLVAIGSGGISRAFPSQWSMGRRVKQVPDSVSRMTGIHVEGDWLGNDFLKGKESNTYHAFVLAEVENFYLPTGYNHVTLIRTKHLLQHEEVKEWIDRTRSERDRLTTSSTQPVPLGPGPVDNILLAAKIWNILKYEWYVSALQIDAAYQSHMQGAAGTEDV